MARRSKQPLLAGALLLTLLASLPPTAEAQQRRTPPAPAPAPAPAGSPAPAAAGEQPAAPSVPKWTDFPPMLVERVYRGPLRDTVVQRWRDPIDGTVCFIYVPISTPIAAEAGQFVQYGSHNIGSVSCVHPTQVVHLSTQAAPPAAAPSGPAAR